MISDRIWDLTVHVSERFEVHRGVMNMHIFWNVMFSRLVRGYLPRVYSPSIFRVNHST